MDASLSYFTMPIIVFCIVGILINTGCLWLVMNVILGSRGDGPVWKCLICSFLLPLAVIIAILLPGRGMFTVMLMCILGGVAVRVVFNVEKYVGISIFVVFMLVALAFYFTFGMLGLNPVRFAVKAAPKPHQGMTKEQFREETKAALIASLEGEYNVGFDLPDDATDALTFNVRPHDGHFRIEGNIDEAYKTTLETPPGKLADWLAANVRRANNYYSQGDFLVAVSMKGPIYSNTLDAAAPGTELVPDFYRIPEELTKFLKKEVAIMTPTTATLAMLKDWQASGAEGLTSTTASFDPTAWELALSAQDLAAFQATPDPKRVKQADYRTTSTDSEESRRYLTTIYETFVSPAGEIELMVEVHREPRTAAEDVYGNKLNLPGAGKREDGTLALQAMIPAFLWNGDQYVSLIDDKQPSGQRYFVCMESFVKDVWFRIKFPVQPTAEQTARFYRLMSMQKLKIARLKK